jgi:glycine/D-amino acid oxidase-like deaminating enzyme
VAVAIESIAASVRRGFYSTSGRGRTLPERAPRVVLAAGAESNGLAIMLGDLVRQNLEAKPNKKVDFAALDGRVSIVADDADVALTLVFERGPSGILTIYDGIVGIPDVTIRGPSDAVVALSNVPIASFLGLPIPGPRDREGIKTVRDLVRFMREGKLHVYGMIFHFPLVMKLTRVMSVNG